MPRKAITLLAWIRTDHRRRGGRQVTDDRIRVIVNEVLAAVLTILSTALAGGPDERLPVPSTAHRTGGGWCASRTIHTFGGGMGADVGPGTELNSTDAGLWSESGSTPAGPADSTRPAGPAGTASEQRSRHPTYLA
ncbi:MAG TPA: hypothetical protein VHH52_04740 [Pseudonocardiaceae bacterium]|nr:hypothetical protein [Pseudonocardiaceae bacterium]